MGEAGGELQLNFLGIGPAFRHGVHPPEEKGLTRELPIRRMPYPDELVLPLRQHAGKPATLCVAVGDHVERGTRSVRPTASCPFPFTHRRPAW